MSLVGSKGTKSSAHQRKNRGLSGQGGHLSRLGFEPLCIAVVGYIDKDYQHKKNAVGSWRWTEGLLLLSSGSQGIPFP